MEAAAVATRRSPGRSIAQRVGALQEANRIRSSRAQLKREVIRGERDPFSMLEHPDCARMPIIDWLVAIPRIGKVKADRVLRMARISSHKTLGGLTDRQRDELRAWLG